MLPAPVLALAPVLAPVLALVPVLGLAPLVLGLAPLVLGLVPLALGLVPLALGLAPLALDLAPLALKYPADSAGSLDPVHHNAHMRHLHNYGILQMNLLSPVPYYTDYRNIRLSDK